MKDLLVFALLAVALFGFVVLAIRRTRTKERQPEVPPEKASGIALPGPSPIRGLEAFTEADASLFRGGLERDRDINRIREALMQDDFRAGILYGPSGVGKTSFLRAGLKSELERHGWRVIYYRSDPSGRFFRDLEKSVKESLAEEGVELNRLLDMEDIITAIENEAPGKKTLFLFDQWEEFFRMPANDRRDVLQSHLIDLVNHKGNRSGSPFRVLFSFRSDWLGNADELAEALGVEFISRKTSLRLDPFFPEQAANILACLAEASGHPVDKPFLHSVCKKHVLDPNSGKYLPVDLQIIAHAFASARKSDQDRKSGFNQATYDRLGGFRGMIDRFLREMLEGKSLEKKLLLVLIHFKTTGESATRESIMKAGADLFDSDQLDKLLQFLQEARLVVRERKEETESWRLTHDWLIERIKVLNGEFSTPKELLESVIQERTRQWLASGRHPKHLFKLTESWDSWRYRKFLSLSRMQAVLIRLGHIRLKAFLLSLCAYVLIICSWFIVITKSGYSKGESLPIMIPAILALIAHLFACWLWAKYYMRANRVSCEQPTSFAALHTALLIVMWVVPILALAKIKGSLTLFMVIPFIFCPLYLYLGFTILRFFLRKDRLETFRGRWRAQQREEKKIAAGKFFAHRIHIWSLNNGSSSYLLSLWEYRKWAPFLDVDAKLIDQKVFLRASVKRIQAQMAVLLLIFLFASAITYLAYYYTNAGLSMRLWNMMTEDTQEEKPESLLEAYASYLVSDQEDLASAANWVNSLTDNDQRERLIERIADKASKETHAEYEHAISRLDRPEWQDFAALKLAERFFVIGQDSLSRMWFDQAQSMPSVSSSFYRFPQWERSALALVWNKKEIDTGFGYGSVGSSGELDDALAKLSAKRFSHQTSSNDNATVALAELYAKRGSAKRALEMMERVPHHIRNVAALIAILKALEPEDDSLVAGVFWDAFHLAQSNENADAFIQLGQAAAVVDDSLSRLAFEAAFKVAKYEDMDACIQLGQATALFDSTMSQMVFKHVIDWVIKGGRSEVYPQLAYSALMINNYPLLRKTMIAHDGNLEYSLPETDSLYSQNIRKGIHLLNQLPDTWIHAKALLIIRLIQVSQKNQETYYDPKSEHKLIPPSFR